MQLLFTISMYGAHDQDFQISYGNTTVNFEDDRKLKHTRYGHHVHL